MDTPASEARSLSKIFGTGADAVRTLDDVSLTIRQNDFFSPLGRSSGFEQPSQGQVFLEGEKLSGRPPDRAELGGRPRAAQQGLEPPQDVTRASAGEPFLRPDRRDP